MRRLAYNSTIHSPCVRSPQFSSFSVTRFLEADAEDAATNSTKRNKGDIVGKVKSLDGAKEKASKAVESTLST
jgi:hypothetical protein